MIIRLAEYAAQFLVDNNITDMFTVTGGGAMFLNNAFGHQKGLKCTYNHHEQACAIAAEGYYRATGKLPAVCVTTGPGGTNALTGVLGSWLDSIPMLVISGQVKFSTTIKSTEVPLRQLGDQEFNITDCVKTMSKYAEMITDPLKIKYYLKKAIFIATHGRPGPVWLDIPINVQSAKIDTDKLVEYDESEDAKEIVPAPDVSVAEQVLDKIHNAKRPVLFVGEGVRIAGMKDQLTSLIEKLAIPVVTAWNAEDLVADANKFNCGRPGTVGTRGGNFVVQNADLVLNLGCRLNIRQISYNYENFAKNAELISVDIDEGELNKPTLKVAIKIHADLKDFIPMLCSGKYECNHEQKLWLGWAQNINVKYPGTIPGYYNKEQPANPYVFIKDMSEALSEGETVVCSNGSACVCSFQAMKIKDNQRIFTNSGCAAMGYGLPAAIGAAVALKGKRVICLEGDGSIQMNIQELQTAVYNKLNLKIFYLNNQGYHSIRQTQTNAFNSAFCGVGEKNDGLSFPQAKKLAKAYGIKYFCIKSNKNITAAVRKIINCKSTTICEVILDKTQFFSPKLSSKTLPDGKIVSPSLEDMYPFLSENEMKENKLN